MRRGNWIVMGLLVAGVAVGCNSATDDEASSDEDIQSSRVTIKGAIAFDQHVQSAWDASKRHGYTFSSVKGAKVGVELLGDASQGPDTLVAIYGPKTGSSFGWTPLATDDDGAGTKFSKLRDVTLPADGDYLVAAMCKGWACKGKTYDLALTCASSSCTEPPPNPATKWTTLVYGSYDTHDAGGIPSSLADMKLKVSADNPDVNLLYLEDLPETGNTKLWKIGARKAEVVKDFGELHMGKSQTLTDAIKLVREQYPSEYFFLDLVGHTSTGVAAFLPDYTPHDAKWEDQRMMYWQVRKAILDSGATVDVLGMSGCGTGDLEIVSRLSDTAKYVVGLQEYSFGYTDVRWADSLARNSAIEPLGLARRVSEGMFKKGYFDQKQPGAVGAYDTSKAAAVKTAFASFSAILNAKVKTNTAELVAARKASQEMSSGGFEFMIDAYDFAEQLEAVTADAEILAAAQAFRAALDEMLVAGGAPNHADAEKHPRAHGINLIFMRPGNQGRISDPNDFDEASAWPAAETSFYEETGWRAFVTEIYPKVK